MCGGPEHGKSSSSSPASSSPSSPTSSCSEGNLSASPTPCSAAAGAVMSHFTVEDEDSSSLLDLAANNDLEGFKRSAERDPSAIDEVGLWYGRRKGSNQMVLEHRTPLMVAATYGSVDVLRLILSLDAADVNRRCGSDKTSALHCAASGGSAGAVDAVKVLLLAGADSGAVDANGCRPADVIVVSPKLPHVKATLEELLGSDAAAANAIGIGDQHRNLRVSLILPKSRSPPLSSSPEEDGSPYSASSPMPPFSALEKEKKEYPVDPSLPDIKNSIYATDEFRMFSFKVRPCSRAYSHDWTECPFVHPGENARRRDPRKYHYSCVPCPDFRKGACRRGDLCEYAHGVFECWLHPAQYRTRLCKDGTGCTRRVCFFAHTTEELRPLYVSTGSAVPSPRASACAAAAMDMAAAMSLLPGSPSSVSMMSPTPFTPPMSPSAGNGGMSHSSLGWPQPNVPTLHLPGSNHQSSRLRSSLSARDIPVDDLSILSEVDPQQLLNEFPSFSSGQARLAASAGNRPGRSKTLTPSNLDDLFSMEMSLSPRYGTEQGAVFSPSHKSAVLNQLQQQQSLLSPINTSIFSSKATADSQLGPAHSSLMQAASFGMMSPGRMSPRSVEPMSPINSRLAALAQREQQQQLHHNLRSLSSRELGSGLSAIVGSPVSSWSKWGSPAGKLDWGVNGDELAGGPAGGGGRFKRSSSFEQLCSGAGAGEEPDVSWVQSLVKEPSPEIKAVAQSASTADGAAVESSGDRVGGADSNSQVENIDQTVLGAWMEQLQLDQLVT